MECQICYEMFDSKNFLPKILIKCGHSICRICLDRLCYKSNIICCPICRSKSRILKKELIPTNFSLLETIEHFKENIKSKNLLEKYKFFDDNNYKHLEEIIIRKKEPVKLHLTKIINEDFIYLEEIVSNKLSFFNNSPMRNKRYNFNRNSIFQYLFNEYSFSIAMYRKSSQCKHEFSCMESIVRSVCNYAGIVFVLNLLIKLLIKLINAKDSFRQARKKIQFFIFIILCLHKIFKCLIAYYMDDLLKMSSN
jgi:hypothetical protein